MEETTQKRKPTIRDIAAVAGVSRGTVSRVINGGHWVSPAALEAVERAIESTGYTANHAARSLATGRAGSLAFLLTEPQQLLFDDPTFALLLRGAATAASQRRQTLVLLVAGTDEERANVEHYVRAGHVDGVMLISSHESDPLLAALVDAGVPTVSCGVPLARPGTPTVSVDEIGSARAMTRHLIDRGYERIAMIPGPDDTPGGRFRLDGFKKELGERFDPELVERGDFSRASGALAMQRILERRPDVQAVFAASDRMAMGAAEALRATGRRIPDDVAVAGFDDSGLAERHDPPLSTMRQPWDRISAEMVSMLLDVVRGVPRAAVRLDTELVVRASTGGS